MEVVGHAVVLDYSSILRLVLGHDAVSIVVEPLRHLDAKRNPKADTAIDTALTAMVMLVVGMKNMDLITQKLSDFVPRMGNECLFVTELQLQFVTQKRGDLVLDFQCFGLRANQSEQKIIGIP